MPVNTKPKNPSPLSASPPVNASDFEENHPVHKALSGAPSPAKTTSSSSDRSLKRKGDTGTQDHKLSVKQPRLDKATPTHNGASTNGRANGSTPASANSLKRKSDDSSTSNTPTNKVRKVANIDTGVVSRYPNNTNNDNHPSPGDSSSSGTSPGLRLSFRQTVELSHKFQQYYKKYEELYWQLAEADAPPTEAQRSDLMKMHKKLEEMKREIKAGVGVTR
jgi:RNA polymerase II elongation factor ELL